MEDWHCERAGFFRAFEASEPNADKVFPMVAYCSPGGSFRTIRQTVSDVRRRGFSGPIFRAYRNGQPSKLLVA